MNSPYLWFWLFDHLPEKNKKQKCFCSISTWAHNIVLCLYLKPICICIGQKFEFRCYPLTADWGVPRATRVSFASLGLWRLHHHMPIVIIVIVKIPSEMEVVPRYTLHNVYFVQYIFTRNPTISDLSLNFCFGIPFDIIVPANSNVQKIHFFTFLWFSSSKSVISP